MPSNPNKKRTSGLPHPRKVSGVRINNPKGTQKEDPLAPIVIESKPGKRPTPTVEIHGTRIRALLDSGASVTALGRDCIKLIKLWKLRTHQVHILLKTADGHIHPCRQAVRLPISFAGFTRKVLVHIAPKIKHRLILGTNFWNEFNIKPAIFPTTEMINALTPEIITVKQKSSDKQYHDLSPLQQKALNETKKLFKWSDDVKLGCTSLIKHKIDTGTSIPIKQKQYHSSPYIQEKINKEIDRMLSLGIIEPASCPKWLNPVIAVKKPNNAIRICLDARKLNSCTIKNAFPQQNLNRILERIQGCKWISTIDLKDAYYQVKIEKSSRECTAFSVSSKGTYQYARMAMGLCNAASTLCELIQHVIGCDLEPQVYPYLDDFLVLSKTFEEHMSTLGELAKRLTSAGLTISSNKSYFCMKQTSYVGYLISQDGIQANPERMAPILEFPQPKNLKAVRRFIGMTGWYSRFIPNYATEIAPITDLLKKTLIPFKWTEQAEVAFDRLKQILTSPQILSPPDFDKPFIIECDASDTGIGAVLVQKFDDQEKVISFYSAKLNKAQRNYTTTEKECLAVILAVEKFRPYIDGTEFTVITDHASLLWLQTMKEPASRLARWSLRLQQYTFKLIHRKGQHNVVPDALSRIYMDEDEQNPSTQTKENYAQEPAEDCCTLSLFDFKETKDKIYLDLCEKAKTHTDKSHYKFDNDLLYVTHADAHGTSWKIYIPSDYVNKIISAHHDDVLAAHGGFWKTLKRIKQKYTCPKLPAQIQEYIKNCESCQANKPSTQNNKSTMGKFRDPKYPFRTIATDFIGPLPRSKQGHKYILTVVDMCTKFTLAFPLRNATGELLIKKLKDDVFLTYGVPEKIICDNGSQYTSTKFDEFLQAQGITKQLTAAYTPRQNPSESYNKILGTAIRTYINSKTHDNWDVNLKEIVCAMNTSANTQTKRTPHELLFGHQMLTHGEQHKLFADVNEREHTELPEKLSILWEDARAALRAAHVQAARQYNKSANANLDYEPGEIVWKKNTELSNKLQKKTHKLMNKNIKCIVLEKLGHNRYALADASTKKPIGTFSTEFMSKARQKQQ